jgi:hypothetical protein
MNKDEFTKGIGNTAYNIGKAVSQIKKKPAKSIDQVSKSTGAPKVYLDMDGVLADFFTEYAKLAGIKSGSYRDIPPAKTDPTLNKMVGTDFFARLPECRNAHQVVELALEFAKSHGSSGYCICSSPLRGDHENSAVQKKIWIQRHLRPQPTEIIIAADKSKYAVQPDGTPNILIDDRGSNISGWEAKGGIGIKYQADENGLDVIVHGLSRANKIIKGQEKHDPQKLVSKDRSLPVATAKDHPTSANDLKEDGATGGSTSAGSIAGVSMPVGVKGKGKKGKIIRRAPSIVV